MIYPLPGTRSATPSCGAGPPRVRRPRARPLRRVTADGWRTRPALPGGRPGGADRARGPLRGAAAGTPSSTVQVVAEDGTVVADVQRFEGHAPQPRPHDPRPRRAVHGRGRARRHNGPHRHRRGRPQEQRPGRRLAPLGEYNRALGREYPPGSTFKIVTADRRCSRRGVTPDTSVDSAADDQCRRALVPELRAVEPRPGPVRPGVRPVVQHRLHLRAGDLPGADSWPRPRATASTPDTRSGSTPPAAASPPPPMPPSTRRPPSARGG